MMKNNKVKDIIVLVLSILSITYFTSTFIHYASAFITGHYINAAYCLSVVLASISEIIAVITNLKNRYVRYLKKNEKIIVTSISSLVLLTSLVMYIMSAKTHFGNLKNGIDNLYVSITCIITYILVAVLNVLSFISLKHEDIYHDRPLEKISKARLIFMIILSLYAGYGLMCLVVGAEIIENFEVYAYGYFVVLLLFVLYIFNFVYFIIDSVKKNKVLEYVNLGANILYVVLFVIAELINFSFLPHVAKPFCPMDFAASIAVLPILSSINIAFMIGYFIYSKVNKNKGAD